MKQNVSTVHYSIQMASIVKLTVHWLRGAVRASPRALATDATPLVVTVLATAYGFSASFTNMSVCYNV